MGLCQPPSFRSDSLDAARAQLDRWGVKDARSHEDRVEEFSHALRSWSQRRRYGVEDAIMSGTRVRLIDQMPDADLDKARCNCAEAGANLLLLAHAMGWERESRVLRYNWGIASDHFGLVLLDDTAQSRLLDPLGGHYGDIRLSKHGVFYRPNGATRPSKIFKGSWSLLDEADLLRHLRYLNSPLGFFPYYENGQIISAVETGLPRLEYHAQTVGEDLNVRVVCDDDLRDICTFERAHQQYAGRAVERDTQHLHFDVGFACIKDVACSRDDTGALSISVKDCSYKWSMPFRLAISDQHLFNKLREARDDEQARGLLARRNEIAEGLVRENEQHWIDALVSADKTRAALAADPAATQRQREELQRQEEGARRRLSWCQRLLALGDDVRGAMCGTSLIYDLFERRLLNREQTEFGFHWWTIDAGDALERYLAVRRDMCKPHIDAYLSSNVHAALLGQYREALTIKRAAQGLLC